MIDVRQPRQLAAASFAKHTAEAVAHENEPRLPCLVVTVGCMTAKHSN